MINELAALARLDFNPAHRPPSLLRTLLASSAAIAGSLLADAFLVAVGITLFPSIKGYTHFRIGDYGELTVIGVVIACIAWPVTTRISAEPRWLFLRMAILVTAVLLLPDAYLLYQGQPARAVGVLALMHLAIGAVTYNALVRIAPAEPAATRSTVGRSARSTITLSERD